MGADQVLGGAWIHAQEVTVASLALHLIPVVLVGGELKHCFFPENDNGLKALVSSDMIVARSAVGLNAIATYHICRP